MSRVSPTSTAPRVPPRVEAPLTLVEPVPLALEALANACSTALSAQDVAPRVDRRVPAVAVGATATPLLTVAVAPPGALQDRRSARP